MSVGVNVVKRFIKAKTPEALTKMMAQMQYKRGTYISFHDIQFVNSFWYAWYETETGKLFIEKGK